MARGRRGEGGGVDANCIYIPCGLWKVGGNHISFNGS